MVRKSQGECTMSYLDVEISKCVKRIQDLMRSEKPNWDKVRIYLYQLSNESYRQGVYGGKSG